MVQALKAKMKDQKGFTLIELLAVIVILGIIAAIAIPAISNVISKSDRKATAQEGVQIIDAAKMYIADHPSYAGGNLTEADLSTEYLDHVKAATFTVTVSKDAPSGKFSYVLKGHPAVTIANTAENATTATEQQLIDAAQ